MKITVKVKPNSKEDSVTPLGNNEFSVRIRQPAIEDRANEAVIEVLSDYFGLPKSTISIVRGRRNKNKVINLSTL